MIKSRVFRPRPANWIVTALVLGVALNGIGIIVTFLIDEFHVHEGLHRISFIFGLPLIIGLSLIYLSSLLSRRKRTAWFITLVLYSFVLILNLLEIFLLPHLRRSVLLEKILIDVVLPAALVYGLARYEADFRVKSDSQSFARALRVSLVVLLVAFAYGVVGFMLMDNHDFHQEISLLSAMHRTIDQFGLTTAHSLTAYTRRARIFIDSLSTISVVAVAYALISLFQPLRAHFSDQSHNRTIVEKLLKDYPASSEDFFKLWPYDKLYFFNDKQTAALAYHVTRGVALVVGDPAGDPSEYPKLITDFLNMCGGNDWEVAFIHTQPQFNELYRRHDLSLQKIGEEAVLELSHFNTSVKDNKYFRHIINKFTKQGYSAELLKPPHHPDVIKRLSEISKEWLTLPNRVERGFMMGYFTPEYLSVCPVMVARDGAGTIQGFINQIPSYDPQEANYDLLRQTKSSLGNINDFLLIKFIDYLAASGFSRLNLGLCPLTGLDKKEADHSVIDSALRLVYANGDRLYSFSGLHRFKAKYEPRWSSRYIAYSGGVRVFTKTVAALNRAMKVKG